MSGIFGDSPSVQPHVLLTAAGLTKNFGGPLASEMWALIFSNRALDAAPRVKEVLRNDFDFESVYNRVMRGRSDLTKNFEPSEEWSCEEQDSLQSALSSAYAHIDEKLKHFVFDGRSSESLNVYGFQEFVKRFAGDKHHPGVCFTLNQDLLLERHYYNGERPNLLGVDHQQDWFTPHRFNAGQVGVSAPTPEFEQSREKFYYLKLHGSCNWKWADRQLMVIGKAKQGQIGAHPLLAKYYDIFRAVLSSGQRRLLCVGYGFMDEHINEAIVAGLRNGLRLYVLSPGSPGAFCERLTEAKNNTKIEHGKEIWSGLAGYFQSDLRALFPPDQRRTSEWGRLRQEYFGEVVRA